MMIGLEVIHDTAPDYVAIPLALPLGQHERR
jgi:hypothetical protein